MLCNDLILTITNGIHKLLEDYEALPEIEKGQVSDQLIMEITIVQDTCEVAKIRFSREENREKIQRCQKLRSKNSDDDIIEL